MNVENLSIEELAKATKAIELDASHPSGSEFQVYFDTSEVIQMVTGKYDFCKLNEAGRLSIHLERLNSLPMSSIPVLAATGLFPAICLLPSHQAEFQSKRRKGFNIDMEKPLLHSGPLSIALLNEIKHLKLDLDPRITELPFDQSSDAGDEDDVMIKTAVNSHASIRRFALLKYLQGHPFNTNILISQKCLTLQEYKKADIAKAVEHEDFPNILREFEFLRRKASPSTNACDALALTSLIIRVQEYKDSGGRPPRYFLSEKTDRLFRTVIDRLGLEEKFTYDLRNIVGSDLENFDLINTDPTTNVKPHTTVHVLQNWLYFFFHGLFGVNRRANGDVEQREKDGGAQEYNLPSRESWRIDFAYTFDKLRELENQRIWVPSSVDQEHFQRNLSDVIDAMFIRNVNERFEVDEIETTRALFRRRKMSSALDEVDDIREETDQDEQSFTWETILHSTPIWWVYANLRNQFHERGFDHGSTQLVEQAEQRLWKYLRLTHLAIDQPTKNQIIEWLSTILRIRESTAQQREMVWNEMMTIIGHPDTKRASGNLIGYKSVIAILISERSRPAYLAARNLLNFVPAELSTGLMNLHCKYYLGQFTVRDIPTLNMIEGFTKEQTVLNVLGLAWAYSRAGDVATDQLPVGGRNDSDAVKEIESIILGTRFKAIELLQLAADIGARELLNEKLVLNDVEARTREELEIFALNLRLHLAIQPPYNLTIAEENANKLWARRQNLSWIPIVNVTMLQYQTLKLRLYNAEEENLAKSTIVMGQSIIGMIQDWPMITDYEKAIYDWDQAKSMWSEVRQDHRAKEPKSP